MSNPKYLQQRTHEVALSCRQEIVQAMNEFEKELIDVGNDIEKQLRLFKILNELRNLLKKIDLDID